MLFDISNPKVKNVAVVSKPDNSLELNGNVSPVGGNSVGGVIPDQQPTAPLIKESSGGIGNYSYTRTSAVDSPLRHSEVMLGLQSPLIPERYEFVKPTGNEPS